MEWELKSDRPIYTQLLEELKRRIVSGYYKPGEKLMPVRELAQEAKVNPNTMQKALVELEELGLIYTERTNGKFVTEDEKLIMKDILEGVNKNNYIVMYVRTNDIKEITKNYRIKIKNNEFFQ